MEAIVLIVLFIAAIAALNLYEFGRIDCARPSAAGRSSPGPDAGSAGRWR